LQWDGGGGIGEEMVMEFGSEGANDDDSPASASASAAIPSSSNSGGMSLGQDTDDGIQSYGGNDDNIDSTTTTSYGGQTSSGGSSTYGNYNPSSSYGSSGSSTTSGIGGSSYSSSYGSGSYGSGSYGSGSYGSGTSSYGSGTTASGYSSSSIGGGLSSTTSTTGHTYTNMYIPKITISIIPAILLLLFITISAMIITAYQIEHTPEGTFANCCRISHHTIQCIYKLLYNIYHCRLGNIPEILHPHDDDTDYTDEELERMGPRPGIEQSLEREHHRAMKKVGIEMSPMNNGKNNNKKTRMSSTKLSKTMMTQTLSNKTNNNKSVSSN
jgi:hypothetical protein